jgi:hypothetical protein
MGLVLLAYLFCVSYRNSEGVFNKEQCCQKIKALVDLEKSQKKKVGVIKETTGSEFSNPMGFLSRSSEPRASGPLAIRHARTPC